MSVYDVNQQQRQNARPDVVQIAQDAADDCNNAGHGPANGRTLVVCWPCLFSCVEALIPEPGGPREEAAKVEGQRCARCGQPPHAYRHHHDGVWAKHDFVAPPSSPEPPASARAEAARNAAEAVVEAWEAEEGESMRDGHRETLVRLIAKSLRAALEPERGEP